MNYYEVLNISRDAGVNEIKRAYFSAVKLHSPDSDPEGFKAIRTAYETLSDKNQRAEYDSYFIQTDSTAVTADLQNNLLAARKLIYDNRYKQAAEFLEELSGKYPDSKEVKLLHAEVYFYMKKYPIADKMCAELLEKNPPDCDTLLLRAKIAESQKRPVKTIEYYNHAVICSPENPKVWSEYIYYAMSRKKSLVSGIFRRAMEQNIDMFRDEYNIYLAGAHDLDMFDQENQTLYYGKFADFFINDKNHDLETYDRVMELIPRFLQKEELVPFVEKILPTLENSRHRTDDDDENFKLIRIVILLCTLRQDKRVHEVLVDLSHLLFLEDKNKDEQTVMECYIVSNLSLLRPSVKVLKNDYPECFRLNQAFYLDVLNEKKESYLQDKYYVKYKKIKPKPFMRGYLDGEEDDDFDEPDDTTPVVRESPKVGRNEPCPCGSGKKYKKCCGKS